MKESRKNLPLEKISNGNYNNVAGNIAGGLQQEGVGKCTDADIRKEKIEWLFIWATEHSDKDINLLISLYQSSLQGL